MPSAKKPSRASPKAKPAAKTPKSSNKSLSQLTSKSKKSTPAPKRKSKTEPKESAADVDTEDESETEVSPSKSPAKKRKSSSSSTSPQKKPKTPRSRASTPGGDSEDEESPKKAPAKSKSASTAKKGGKATPKKSAAKPAKKPSSSTKKGKRKAAEEEEEEVDEEEPSNTPKSAKKRASTATKSAGKAAEESEEEEESDLEEDSGPESDDEDDVDFEGVKTKKAPTKKAPTKKALAKKASAPSKGRAQKPPTKAVKFTPSEIDGVNLFRAIKNGAALEEFGRRVVALHHRNSLAALAVLVNGTFCCAGCASNIIDPSKDIADFDEDEWNAELEEACDDLEQHQTKVKYPIIDHNTKEMKKFRANIKDWWKKFVQASRHGNEIEHQLLSNLIRCLQRMSSIQVVPIRHTATFMALELGNALVESLVEMEDKLSKSKRQLTSEKSKTSNSNKAKSLSAQISSMNTCIEAIILNVRQLSTDIVQHRVLDVRPKVREDCLQGLGTWAVNAPDKFLVDTILKYFGSLLSDSDPNVRRVVAFQLRRFVALEDFMDRLVPFIDRFHQRIIEMLEDVDDKVATEAAKLARDTFEAGFFALDDAVELSNEEIEVVTARAFDPSAPLELRQELAHIVVSQLCESFDDDDKEATEDVETRSMSQLDEVLEYVKRMIGSAEFTAADPFVEALVATEKGDVLQDWSAITGRLLVDRGEADLTDHDIRLLIHIFIQALKAKESASSKAKTDSSFFESLSLELLKSTPSLLEKFKSETSCLKAVLELPKYILTHTISSNQHKSKFQKLLTILQDIHTSAMDLEVLHLSASALQHLQHKDHARGKDVDATIQRMCDHLTDRLKSVLDEKKGKRKKSSSDESTFSAMATMRQLSSLSCVMDLQGLLDVEEMNTQAVQLCHSYFTLPNLARVAGSKVNGAVLSVGEQALVFVYSTLLWPTRHFLVSKLSDQKTTVHEPDVELATIIERRKVLVELLMHILGLMLDENGEEVDTLDSNSAWEVRKVQNVACAILGDLQVLHKPSLDHYEAHELSWTPPSDLLKLSAKLLYSLDPRAQTPVSTSPDLALEHLKALESHIKFIIYNPGHWNQPQAGFVLDFFSEPDSSPTLDSARYCYNVILEDSGFSSLLGAQMTSLQFAYSKKVKPLVDEEDDEDFLVEFKRFQTLAQNLASALGGANRRKRDEKGPFLNFMKEGIRFAFDDPKNLNFLAGLMSFLGGLDSKGKGALQDDLERYSVEEMDLDGTSDTVRGGFEVAEEFRVKVLGKKAKKRASQPSPKPSPTKSPESDSSDSEGEEIKSPTSTKSSRKSSGSKRLAKKARTSEPADDDDEEEGTSPPKRRMADSDDEEDYVPQKLSPKKKAKARR